MEDKKLSTKAFTFIVLAAVAVIIIIYMVFGGGGGVKNDADGCNVNFQSAWGQTLCVWAPPDRNRLGTDPHSHCKKDSRGERFVLGWRR